MSTYGNMLSDLNLLGMASLIGQDFGALLNKCQREEVESYPWSFLFQSVTIYGSAPIQTGTIAIIQGKSLVSLNGGNIWPETLVSSNSVNPQPFPYLTPSGILPDNSFYLWAGATLSTPLPLIGLFDTIFPTGGANIAFLQAATQLASNPTSFYTLQQIYYPIAPLQTVFRVRQIDDLIETSQAELNNIDPSRLATGGSPSLRWSQAPFAQNITDLTFSTGRGRLAVTGVASTAIDSTTPMIELWPRSTQSLPYIVDGKVGAIDMVLPADLPMIPSQVLEAKAMMYACRAIFASSGNPKWFSLAQEYNKDYLAELEKAKTEDSKRIIPKGITSWGGRRLFDASVDFDHDLAGPPGGFSAWT